jgi:hypothetical protein
LAVGFRFHQDVRATIIFEQLVKEHGRAKVLRAFDGFLEEFPNPFEAETALHEFTRGGQVARLYAAGMGASFHS